MRFRHRISAWNGWLNGEPISMVTAGPVLPSDADAGPGWGAVAIVTFVLGVVMGAFL